MKVEFVITVVGLNRYFTGYEKHTQEPKLRHVNFPDEFISFDSYPEAEKAVENILERYEGNDVLRLQIEKHYVKE